MTAERHIAESVAEGYVTVPAKIEPKGPRAQVITPSDCVRTREGQILAVALHAAEERELDLLAKIGKLERLLDDAINGCSMEWIIERRALIDGDDGHVCGEINFRNCPACQDEEAEQSDGSPSNEGGGSVGT